MITVSGVQPAWGLTTGSQNVRTAHDILPLLFLKLRKENGMSFAFHPWTAHGIELRGVGLRIGRNSAGE